MTKEKTIFVAVTNDVSTDQRIHKICSYLVSKKFKILVYGRILPDTFEVNRPYKIIRKKHWFSGGFLFYAEYNIRLFFFLFFKKFDYVISNDLDTLPACFFASKFNKSTLVYDSHELFSEGPELQGRYFVQNFWRSLENYFLPRVKKAYTVSDSISKFYDDKYKNKMGVIRNLPLLNQNRTTQKVNFPTKNKVVLYQGVLNPGRGIKTMIKALHFLKNVDLVIIGYGKVKYELEEFVLEEKIQQRVHFLGRIPHNKLSDYTKIADIGMVLEEPLGKSFEFSLPNKLFDYIHAEIPIITGNLPEINKIIQRYKVGVSVKKPTPQNIAVTITNLLENQSLRKEIKEYQQKAKKVLCWENECKKLDTYFN